MNSYRDIIKAPVITEKSASLAQNANTYIFKVDAKANKTAIKQAVEHIFNVKVENVNTINVRGKAKRVGRYRGTTAKYKKAMVKLAEGSTIDLN